MDHKQPPGVDVTDRDLEPVESADSLRPVDTHPDVDAARETLRPQDTADEELDALPLARATSTTQLLDDDVVAGPTLDLLPKVTKQPKRPPEEAPQAPKASPKKPAQALEAESAPVSRKLPRKKLVGREDQFESGSSGSLDKLVDVHTAATKEPAAALVPIALAGALGGLVLLGVLAWLLW
ncbi:MAG: hypothetical protein AB1938_01710 [Myxococcota bacterium]